MLLQYVVTVVAAAALAWPAAGEIASGRGAGAGGWLGRLVQYHKAAFLNDLQKVDNNMVDIEASVETAPVGYSDPPGWDEHSVLRLLSLVSQSRAPSIKPVKRALRRALRPTRRYKPYIPPGLSSHDLFPSLTGNIENFIYNDYYSEESTSEEMSSNERHQLEWEKKHTTMTAEQQSITEQEKLAVLVVRNPVEARLPSARISVRLLRKIMEERAMAARVVTPSTKRTLTWLPRYNATVPLKQANVTTTTPASKVNGGNGTKEIDKSEKGKEDVTEAAENGAPANGTAADGAPADGAPIDVAAADGAAADGVPADGAPADDGGEGDEGGRRKGREIVYLMT